MAKGPVSGAQLCAYELTPAGKGQGLGCTLTDADGAYTLVLPNSGEVVLEASGGSYRDEATAATTMLGTPLRTAVAAPAGLTTTAMITPLTHFAYVQAASQGLTLARFTASAATVRDAIAPEVDILAGKIVVRDGADNAYGAALRTVSRALANGATIDGLAQSITRPGVQAGLRQSRWCVADADGHLAGWNVLVEANLQSPGPTATPMTVTVQQPDPTWSSGLAWTAATCTVTESSVDLVTLSCPSNVLYNGMDIRAGGSAAQRFTDIPRAGEVRAAGQRVRIAGGPVAVAPGYVLHVSAAGGIVDLASAPPAGGSVVLDTNVGLVGMEPRTACALAADGTARVQPLANGDAVQPGTITSAGTMTIGGGQQTVKIYPDTLPPVVGNVTVVNPGGGGSLSLGGSGGATPTGGNIILSPGIGGTVVLTGGSLQTSGTSGAGGSSTLTGAQATP